MDQKGKKLVVTSRLQQKNNCAKEERPNEIGRDLTQGK